MTSPRKNSGEAKLKRPPATTLESRENQMISLAVDLAEKQLADGTATSQVIVHYLKLGTVREGLEREKLRKENLLLQAKSEQIESQKNVEAMMKDALNAMRSYTGGEHYADEDD